MGAKRLRTKRPRNLKTRAMLVADVGGKICFADPAARRWLKRFFGRPQRAGLLPRTVSGWISGRNQRHVGRSLVAKTPDGQLYLKRERSYTHDNLVLLFELIKGKSEERR